MDIGLILRVYPFFLEAAWVTIQLSVLTALLGLTCGALGAAARMSRIPPGHPEGYLEGFANIYTEAALAIRAAQAGTDAPADVVYPSVQDGLEGVAFVDACVRSSGRNGAWVKLAI